MSLMNSVPDLVLASNQLLASQHSKRYVEQRAFSEIYIVRTDSFQADVRLWVMVKMWAFVHYMLDTLNKLYKIVWVQK